MANIERYNSAKVQRIENNLIQAIFRESVYEDDYIQLVITIEAENINVKELSTSLDLIYRIDGQTSEIGYDRYVHVPNSQIHISKIRFGSVEIIIEKAIEIINSNSSIIILGLFLKHFPNFLKQIGESIKTYYEIQNLREDNFDKKEKRKLRSDIRNSLMSDNDLNGIDKPLIEKLVKLFETLIRKNTKHLPSAIRFARKYLKSITIRKKRK